MSSFSHHNLILVRYPFSDLTSSKVRPAVIVNGPHFSRDLLIVPVTSQLMRLLPGEYILSDWKGAGLNVPSAIKRGVYTVEPHLVQKIMGQLQTEDGEQLDSALRAWLLLT